MFYNAFKGSEVVSLYKCKPKKCSVKRMIAMALNCCSEHEEDDSKGV